MPIAAGRMLPMSLHAARVIASRASGPTASTAECRDFHCASCNAARARCLGRARIRSVCSKAAMMRSSDAACAVSTACVGVEVDAESGAAAESPVSARSWRRRLMAIQSADVRRSRPLDTQKARSARSPAAAASTTAVAAAIRSSRVRSSAASAAAQSAGRRRRASTSSVSRCRVSKAVPDARVLACAITRPRRRSRRTDSMAAWPSSDDASASEERSAASSCSSTSSACRSSAWRAAYESSDS